jgi:hypothetical protein
MPPSVTPEPLGGHHHACAYLDVEEAAARAVARRPGGITLIGTIG